MSSPPPATGWAAPVSRSGRHRGNVGAQQDEEAGRRSLGAARGDVDDDRCCGLQEAREDLSHRLHLAARRGQLDDQGLRPDPVSLRGHLVDELGDDDLDHGVHRGHDHFRRGLLDRVIGLGGRIAVGRFRRCFRRRRRALGMRRLPRPAARAPGQGRTPAAGTYPTVSASTSGASPRVYLTSGNAREARRSVSGDRNGSQIPTGAGGMVGARGFEPPASRSRTVRSTRLSYAPSHRYPNGAVRAVREPVRASVIGRTDGTPQNTATQAGSPAFRADAASSRVVGLGRRDHDLLVVARFVLERLTVHFDRRCVGVPEFETGSPRPR